MDIFTRYEISKSVMQTSSLYAVDTKFNKVRAKATEDADSDDIIKLNNLSVKEGSHRVRVAQDMSRDDDKPKKI
jgi:hypothetical protein